MSDCYVVELRPDIWLTAFGTGRLNEAKRFASDHEARAALSDARMHGSFTRAKVRVFGVAVQCAECHRPKAPRGRDIALAASGSWCHHTECDSYNKDPQPGAMWPGEVER